MPPSLRHFTARHPLVRDAVLWALPAIVFGAGLRLLLLYYVPFAYWGSDSSSYYSFVHLLFERGAISLDEKRRFLYPLLMLPVSLLPGSTLRWLAWLQHGLGLLTIIPLAYTVRKTLAQWRWWVVPLTAAYATMPMVLWYEHELLGEVVFFATMVWAVAGWCAWAGTADLARARRLFWAFFVPLALFILTKPSGRFVWPGLCVGFVLLAAWRRLTGRQVGAIVALMLVTLAVGSRKQGAWLLYVATFPLTQLDTPLHADYKAEIRDLVEPRRAELDSYAWRDHEIFDFLEDPGAQDVRPLWKALGGKNQQKSALYMDLALEAVKAHPGLFLYLSAQRIAASVNPSAFKESRFRADFYPDKFAHHYERAAKDQAAGQITSMPRLLGLPKREPLPPYEEFRQRLSPHPDSLAEKLLIGWVLGYEGISDLVKFPDADEAGEPALWQARVTPLGWWLAAGALLSLLPAYRHTLGVWMIVAVSYLLGVFLVSQLNPRYFGPAWAMLVPLLAVPADVAVRVVRGRASELWS